MFFLFCVTLLEVPATSFDSLVMQGLQYSYQENYSKAFNAFFALSQLDPENPLPYLFIAGVYGLYINDFSIDTKDTLGNRYICSLLAYCDTTITLAKKRMVKGNNSAILHLCLGGGYGLRSFYNISSEKLISGIQDALKSIDEFSKTLELDSSLADAYIGVSAYDYFKYRLLFLMPWARDTKWEEEIKISCSKSKYFSVPASAGYIGLLIEEKRFEEAIKISSSLVDKFPDSRTFRWLRVKAFCGAKKWDDAKTDYEKLLELTLTGQSGNLYNESCCRIGLAEVLFELGEKEECKKQCEKIIVLPANPKIKKAKERAKKLLQEIVDKR